jgi:benzoyl-CoA reductase/2-hydroxyglutaryl-CoA dehydratase subunit BcrC/BadD/HgdB
MAPIAAPSAFRYPTEIRGDFLKTPGLDFADGSHVSAEEIWRFMTEEAPRRFPHTFATGGAIINRLSSDVRLFSGIKRSYLTLTLKDRVLKAHERKIPIVLIQGGQTLDPYYAAGAIPLRPGFVMGWARDMQEGLSVRQNDQRGIEIMESGRNRVSMESCNQIAAHAAISGAIVPIDLIAPYLCLRCSDMAYLVESHRSRQGVQPLMVVDQPIDQVGKPWAADLVAAELRKLVARIDALTGRRTTDEAFRRQIQLHNRIRKLAREIVELNWAAEEPPLNSQDSAAVPSIANDFAGDPVATLQVISEMKEEVALRVRNRVRAEGLNPNPKRLFICGSCVGPNSGHVEDAGAVLVGRDDNWSSIFFDVAEQGDPYRASAEAILAYPYEQPTEQRAAWTVDMIRRSRAQGVVFMYNWGCNFQTGVARLLSDIIKDQTGLPATFIEVGELGRSEATEQSENRIEAFIEMI